MFPTIVFGDTVIERKEYVAALKAQHGAARLYFQADVRRRPGRGRLG